MELAILDIRCCIFDIERFPVQRFNVYPSLAAPYTTEVQRLSTLNLER
jgi:hypothetical protein